MSQLEELLQDHPKWTEIKELIKDYGSEQYDEGYDIGMRDAEENAS